MHNTDKLAYENYILLLADESAHRLRIIVDGLREAGFRRWFIARNGDVALERIARHRPDLAIVNVGLPGLSVFELCRHLQEDPATEHIPVILMTSGAEEWEQGFQAGAADYVMKPVGGKQLLTRITVHLRLRDLERELRRLSAEECP